MFGASFKNRMISGFTLGPLALAIILYGGIPFKILLALSFGVAVHEWISMAKKGKHIIRDSILGFVYIALCFLAFWKLRLDLDQGVFLVLCLCLGVCVSDVAAYFSGKMIGGPKMAPDISPNKTWAGFLGGALGSGLMVLTLNHFATLIGSIVRLDWTPFTSDLYAFIVGVLFTFFGQIGDLLVSSYKRKVDVKDTGTIIPGHGGLLDRIDSVMLATVFFLIAVMELGA